MEKNITQHTISSNDDDFETKFDQEDANTYLPASIQLVAFSYNSKDFVEGFLDSLVKQALYRFDICIIDLGSTDGSWEMLKDWELRPGIVFRQHQATGLSPFDALNKASYISLFTVSYTHLTLPTIYSV